MFGPMYFRVVCLMSFLRRYNALLIGIGIFFLAFFPRAIGLSIFSTINEKFWLDRSLRFLDSVSRAEWHGTLRSWVHPGITTQWLGALGILAYYFPDIALTSTGILVSGKPLIEVFQPSFEILAFARYPIALLASLLVVTVYVALRRTFGTRIAVFAALLVAFDPFSVALSRVLLTDGLHAVFSCLAILCLVLAFQSDDWKWWAISGISGGLAFLSKSPAAMLVFLVPFLSMIIYLSQPGDSRRWTQLLVRLSIWYGAMILCTIIVWPAMWVQPLKSIQGILETMTYHSATERWRRDTGPRYFYPLVILFRGSPFVLVGAMATLLPLTSWLRNVPKRRTDQKEVWLLCLWGMVVAYVIMFSLGAHKTDLYIAPVYVAITILGAIGLTSVLGRVVSQPYIPREKQGLLLNIGVGLLLALQVVLCFSHYPYYLTYFNPLAGGRHAAEKVLPSWGHGEGFDQAVRYLNSQENAEDLYVGMNVIRIFDCVELDEFKGHAIAFPDKWTGESDRHWSQLDYVVYYRDFGKYRLSRLFTDLIDSTSPDFTAEMNGIEYAWVYKIPTDKLMTLPPEAHQTEVEYENCLELVGYEIHPMTQRRDGTQQLPVSLYWQASEYCRDDYQVVLKLRNDAYSEWGSKDIFPACEGWESSWRDDLIMPDEHSLKVLPGTPAGSYTLEMVVLHRPGGQEMQPENKWSGILGTIEIPSHPDLEVHSLDMEHEVNARLSDQVMLLGYNVAGGAQPGETVHLTLFWQALADMDDSYKVFVHVVDDQGNLLSQKDSYPVDGFYPTSLWQKDEIVRDQYRITFSDDSGATAAGLQIGMYLPATGERLPVVLSKGEMPENRAVPLP